MSGEERRVSPRFDLALPLSVRVQVPAAAATALGDVGAATKDISGHGLYFHVGGEIAVGTPVECELTLPPELCQGNTVQVRCKGRIVRVDPAEDDGSTGMAVVLDDCEFVEK